MKLHDQLRSRHESGDPLAVVYTIPSLQKLSSRQSRLIQQYLYREINAEENDGYGTGAILEKFMYFGDGTP
jgi:hypothetical protein